LLAIFFWPLFIGVVISLHGMFLWGFVALFFIGGLLAAWPR
jgi:hypothetical protein